MRKSIQQTFGPMELNPVGTGSPTLPNRLGEWRAIVSKSLGRAGISQKGAAADLGVTESAFSKQLGGGEHLSFWRMQSLPPTFWRELIVLVAEFHEITVGGTQQDIEDAAIGRCVREAVKRCR